MDILDSAAATSASRKEIFYKSIGNLIDSIQESARAIGESPHFSDDRNCAAGLEHVVRTLYQSIDRVFWQNPDYPLFRKLDFRAGYGGDSPDQQYLQTFIRGGESYRIWGKLKTERMIDVRLYSGLPWAGGEVSSNLMNQDIAVGPDGEIEIIASPARTSGNWLENPPGGTEIMIRQICGDWATELPGEWHIDRIGHEGDLKPNASLQDNASLVDAVSAWMQFGSVTFIKMMERDILPMPVNTIAPHPIKPTAFSNPGIALKTKVYQFGHFDLEPDEALVVTVWPLGGVYQGIALDNMWFFNPEYQQRQSSLSDHQSVLTSDGAYHFVVAHSDPGTANWLDTTGLKRGLLCLRYEGVPGHNISADRQPSARKIKFTEVHGALPQDMPFLSPVERANAIRSRRLGLQIRNAQ